MTVAGLVLAAGAGRRFGGPKALVELAGETLLERASRVLREAGCSPVVAVVGDLPQPVRAGAAELVRNPYPQAGIGASLRLGLSAVRGSAVVVMLVDTPGVGAEVVRRLLWAYEAGATLAVAAYDGRPRNPVLLARAHWDGVAGLAVGDVGARSYLVANQHLVTVVECGDVADGADVDVPADLRRFTSD